MNRSNQSKLTWHGQKLDAISVEDAIFTWLQTLSPKTRLNYQSGMFKLIDLGLIDPLMNLQAFSLVNHESMTTSSSWHIGLNVADKLAPHATSLLLAS